jgi:hypothetical protein
LEQAVSLMALVLPIHGMRTGTVMTFTPFDCYAWETANPR